MKVGICTILALTIVCSAATGSESSATPENKDWLSFVGQAKTNYAMKDRARKANIKLNRRMAEVVNSLKQQLDKRQEDLLVTSQNAWRKQAEAQSSLLADRFRGGTHEGLEFQAVLIPLKKSRIKDLLEILNRFRDQ